jgi:uncharacterized protein
LGQVFICGFKYSREDEQMSLKVKIKESMTAAMKSKDAERLQVIRNIWNVIRKKEIDDRKDLTDTDVEKAIMTMAKQLQESLDQAKNSGREDIVVEVQKELAILKEYMPEMLKPEELEAIVNSLVTELKASASLPEGNAGMGMLMKKTMEKVGSKADGKSVQAAVRKALQL